MHSITLLISTCTLCLYIVQSVTAQKVTMYYVQLPLSLVCVLHVVSCNLSDLLYTVFQKTTPLIILHNS